MKTQMVKWGNSLAVRIPKPFVEAARLKEGDPLRRRMSDALIAAAATINRAQLWTRNRKHYPMKELAFY